MTKEIMLPMKISKVAFDGKRDGGHLQSYHVTDMKSVVDAYNEASEVIEEATGVYINFFDPARKGINKGQGLHDIVGSYEINNNKAVLRNRRNYGSFEVRQDPDTGLHTLVSDGHVLPLDGENEGEAYRTLGRKLQDGAAGVAVGGFGGLLLGFAASVYFGVDAMLTAGVAGAVLTGSTALSTPMDANENNLFTDYSHAFSVVDK